MDTFDLEIARLNAKLGSKMTKHLFEKTDFTIYNKREFLESVYYNQVPRLGSFPVKTVEIPYTQSKNEDDINGNRLFYDVTDFLTGSQNTNDYYGEVVAMSGDGNVIAVASYRDSSNRGFVDIYRYSGGTWNFNTKLSGGNNWDVFGKSVALSYNGEYIVIGANGVDGGLIDRGSTTVYKYNEVEYIQYGSSVFGTNNADELGLDVDISDNGDYYVTGGRLNNQGGYSDNGEIKVIFSSSSLQVGQSIYGTANNTRVGTTVSISGDGHTISFGSSLSNSSGNDKVFTYTFNTGNGMWEKVTELEITENGFTIGGMKMSKDKSTLVVSNASYNSGRGKLMYYKMENNEWVYKDSVSGTSAGEEFATSVELNKDGSVLAVASLNSEYVRRYEYVDSKLAYSNKYVSGSSQGFGSSIGISADGNKIVVGTKDALVTATNSGSAKVYDYLFYPKYETNVPENPTVGMTYYDSTSERIYTYNGTSWVFMSKDPLGTG